MCMRSTERYSLSEHAYPLRAAHTDGACSAAGQVKRNAACKWTAIVDHHRHGRPVLRVCHRHPRSEGQGSMRGRISAWIESLAARRPPACDVVGRDHVLAGATADRFGVSKEPGESPAVCRKRRGNEPRKSNDTKN